MGNLSEIYNQLNELAQQNNKPVEALLDELYLYAQDQPNNTSSDLYIQTLGSAIAMLEHPYEVDTLFEMLFGYITELISFDVAIGLTHDNGMSQIQYIHPLIDCDFEVGQHLNLGSIIPLGDKFLIWDDTIPRMGVSIFTDVDMRSTLAIPILYSGEVIGYLLFGHQQPDVFDENLVTQLQPFVNIASAAIQNTRLITTISQSTDELATLYHATSVLFRADSLSDFASQITEVVVRTFNYADCGLLVVNQEQKEIVRVRRAGPEMAMATHRILLNGHGLVPKAIRDQHVVYEADVRQSLDYVAGDARSLSELVVPLKGAQGILGVLDFQATVVDAFNERDQRLMVAFAERIAPILENVLLYDELRQYAIQLQTRVAERTLELQQTKEQLETIIRSSPDAIVLLDRDGVIKQGNLAWVSMVGLSYPEVHHAHLSKFLLPKDREIFQDAVKQTLEDGLENDISVMLYNRSYDKEIPVEISIAPILEGRESGVVCNIRDVTQHVEAERVLRDALDKSQELSELKTRFVTMASHEFRTPLTTILSSSDIVSTYYDRLSTEAIHAHLDKIIREVTYLNKLIEDIVIIGREADEGFKPNYSAQNLNELARQHIDEVRIRDSNRHPIRVKISEQCHYVVTDDRLITYIIDNLLENACKYSPEGHPILIEISCGNAIRITVRDKGIGIPEVDSARLFDTFYRGSNVGNIRGTGIGLAIVQSAVKAMGGQIDVRSKVNQGTVISIQLPLQPDEILE